MPMNNLPPLNEYESQAWRPLTFAERKVNLVSIKENMKRLWEKLDAKLVVVKNDILNGQGSVPYNVETKLAEIVTEVQKEAFDFGKQTASAEMKTKVKPTNKKLEGVMLAQNKQIVKRMLADINAKFKQKWYKTFAEYSVEFSEAGIFSQFFNGLKSLFVMGAINLGRETVFESEPDRVYAFQYSAILDDRTSDLCRGLDGVIVKPWSPRFKQISPPNHWNCRSIWVEILIDEPYKPAFTKQERIETQGINKPTVEKLELWQKMQERLIDIQNVPILP